MLTESLLMPQGDIQRNQSPNRQLGQIAASASREMVFGWRKIRESTLSKLSQAHHTLVRVRIWTHAFDIAWQR
jgi:hypothetical protein